MIALQDQAHDCYAEKHCVNDRLKQDRRTVCRRESQKTLIGRQVDARARWKLNDT